MKTTLVLVRHGQTVWNREDRFRGRANISLDEIGKAQAEVTARHIAAHWPPDAIYCSPLLRARQTAEKIAERFSLHERAHPGFLDIDYGAWEGLTPAEVRAQDWSPVLDLWYEHPQDAPIPGGETLQSVRLRATGALNEVVERHAGETIAIVSHTVVNRLLLLSILDLSNDYFWRLKQDVCAVNLLEFDGKHYTLVTMNDTCHLGMVRGEIDILPQRG